MKEDNGMPLYRKLLRHLKKKKIEVTFQKCENNRCSKLDFVSSQALKIKEDCTKF